MQSIQLLHPVRRRLRNLERMREISRVAVRHGFGYFFERHKLLGLIPRWRPVSTRLPTQRGRHIREMLDELGPTFVKFGQLLSTRPDIVPPDIVEELVRLQDDVSPFDFSIVDQVIREDLGLTIVRAFESFDAEPLASASIGQVHSARLPGGRKVVVKVQRPDAARRIGQDIELLLQFAELLEGRLEIGFSLVELVREFARTINRELDYVLEARNAARFSANFADDDSVRIPALFARYCSSRILTMERIEGPTLNDPAIMALPLEERKVLAETISACWFRQILHHGFVHADPHPANIVYLGEGRIGLLDFGMVSVLRADDLEEGTKLFLRVMRSDIPGIKRSLKRLGMQWHPAVDEAVTQAIEDSFSRYFGVSVKNVDVRTLLHQVIELVYSLRLRLPSRFLALDKAVLTLEGVVNRLYPDINLFEIAGRYTGELKWGLVDPRRVPTRLQRYAAEYAQIFSEYPLQVYDVLNELRDGEVEIKFRHTGLEGMIHRLDVIANRVVVALVSIALGVTGMAVAVTVDGGPQVGGLSLWGIPGLVAALIFGVWLIYAIIRSGRL